MATSALVSNSVLCNSPMLIRRLKCTGGTTSAALTHGEDRSPDLAFASVQTESPTVTTVVVKRDNSATTILLDTLGDAADNIDVYLIWLTGAKGGIS